MCTLQFAAL
ncbi:hypothetical protein F383_23790 [Gossypium arboreum]|uniref:Uncharacterized protein n=1 Tax=Gossypium arboreum TaxID=29729 RepID=A0A0B0NXS1_GOSAR|nr:hypothetical protein F383_23790 [Gossypium arboreum]